nr:hypothetical protein BaRGS_033277 [Batillaria attramentaria]
MQQSFQSQKKSFLEFDSQNIKLGYADDKIVLDWMNTTEPDTMDEDRPVIINENVELPQFEFAVVNVLSRKDSLRDFSIRRVFSIPKDVENGTREVREDY